MCQYYTVVSKLQNSFFILTLLGRTLPTTFHIFPLPNSFPLGFTKTKQNNNKKALEQVQKVGVWDVGHGKQKRCPF
jgi:hypothetical protein